MQQDNAQQEPTTTQSDAIVIPSRKRKAPMSMEDQFCKSLTPDEKMYWDTLSLPERTEMVRQDQMLRQADISATVPLRFRFLTAPDIPISTKLLVLAKLEQFQLMTKHSSEYFKYRNWMMAVSRLPFSIYRPLPIQPDTAFPQIALYLQQVRQHLDNTVYGHELAKNQLMRILSKWISNPTARGNCIGIYGAMGTGKTSLIKEGLGKALGLPIGFVALGGATDASFLCGHNFTYEGSTYGKIAEVLMKAKCMNPIIFFDELDKVSATSNGEEIIGTLTHLTDSTQNERFHDRYFGEIELDLSKCLIVCSYNDETKIDPILKDRMITIQVQGYTTQEKLVIAKQYLLPEILQQYAMSANDIQFSDAILRILIERTLPEEGVRNLKRGMDAVVSWINMHRYIPHQGQLFQLPVKVTKEMIEQLATPQTL